MSLHEEEETGRQSDHQVKLLSSGGSPSEDDDNETGKLIRQNTGDLEWVNRGPDSELLDPDLEKQIVEVSENQLVIIGKEENKPATPDSDDRKCYSFPLLHEDEDEISLGGS